MPPRQFYSITPLLRSNRFPTNQLLRRTLATSTSSPTPLPAKRRTLWDLSFIALAGLTVSGALIWRRSQKDLEEKGDIMKEGERTAFTVPVLTQ